MRRLKAKKLLGIGLQLKLRAGGHSLLQEGGQSDGELLLIDVLNTDGRHLERVGRLILAGLEIRKARNELQVATKAEISERGLRRRPYLVDFREKEEREEVGGKINTFVDICGSKGNHFAGN